MMEIKVNVEINISEATQKFFAQLAGAPVLIKVPAAEKVEAPALTAVAPEEKPEPAKKKAPAKKTESLEEVKEVIKPKEEPKPAAPDLMEKLDYAEKRKTIKAFCAARKAEGVNIPKLVHEFLGTANAKFSQIPDERLDEFNEIVKAAEVE